MNINSFAPVTALDTRVVILGSIPGIRSLTDQQYYAHPRNAFWPIMTELLGRAELPDYPKRLVWLQNHGVSLWDVLHGCYREGSLDSAIDKQTEQPNLLRPWFEQMPNLSVVALNSGAAYKGYQQYFVKSGLHPANVNYVQLPSTSPAYAAMPFETKLEKWRQALQPFLNLG